MCSSLKHPIIPFSVHALQRSVCLQEVCEGSAHICRRSSGTSRSIFRKVLLVAGVLGLTGLSRSSVTISFSVASQAAYSMT